MPHSRKQTSMLPLLALMGAVLMAMGIYNGARPDVSGDTTTTTAEADAKDRGVAYEDHVFEEHRLPAEVQAQGGTLRLHPRIFPPRVRLPARFYRSPQGYDSGAVLDRRPLPTSMREWTSLLKGGYRIPDALATYPDGTQVLYELKCPSPWLTFDGGEPWATKMQLGFASQALAFFAWAAKRPERRQVFYGFCGEIPPWASAILDDLSAAYPTVVLEDQRMYKAQGFKPAEQLVHRATRDAMLTVFESELPDALFGPVFDRMKD